MRDVKSIGLGFRNVGRDGIAVAAEAVSDGIEITERCLRGRAA